MKKITPLLVMVLLAAFLHPAFSPAAQTSLPQVPVTYPGDTDSTIKRRAQWIEEARKEGRLVWWGVLHPNEKIAIMAEFTKLYPFITLEGWRGGPTETATKLESAWSARIPGCDISTGGSYNLPRWREMGKLKKFTDIIPNIDKWDRRAYSSFGDFASPGAYVASPQYNTRLVSAAEAPKSWEDFFDPKHRGQIGIVPEMKHWWTMALDGGWGMEKTEAYLRRLKEQNLIWGRGNSAVHALLLAGEFKVSVTGYVRHVQLSQKKGAPVEWIRAKPLIVFPSSTYAPENGPNPNAARLFIEWLFSSQGLSAYEAITGVGSVDPASGSKISKLVEGLPLAYETEEVLKKAIDLQLNDRFASILGVPK